MSLYWLYDLPSWLFAGVVILVFEAFGVGGLWLTRGAMRRIHKVDHSHNDIVGYYLAALTVFYGITLGLVAVGTWSTFSGVSDKVDAEAQVLASLYRDVGAYPEPKRTELRTDLARYVDTVVRVSWPQQREGIVPSSSGAFLDAFEAHLMGPDAQQAREGVLQAEVFRQFNVLVELRRSRLNAVNTGLPLPIWALVIIGGCLCLVTTWFFHTASFAMHLSMTVLTCALLGLIVFMIAILDHPFRGEVSVGVGPLRLVQEQLMRGPVTGNGY